MTENAFAYNIIKNSKWLYSAQNLKTMNKKYTSRITPISFCYLMTHTIKRNNNWTRTKRP